MVSFEKDGRGWCTPTFTDHEALLFHSQGRPRQSLEGVGHQADGDPA